MREKTGLAQFAWKVRPVVLDRFVWDKVVKGAHFVVMEKIELLMLVHSKGDHPLIPLGQFLVGRRFCPLPIWCPKVCE